MSAETTPAPLEPGFVQDFGHRLLDAWNRYDAAGVSALFTEDVEFTDPAIGTVHGRPAVAEWVRTCTRAFPDYRFEEPEPPYLAAGRPKALAPWHLTGTHTGPIEPPGFAATGRPFVVDGVDHWTFRDGLVAVYRADWDVNGLMRQLGIVPEQGSRGERAMVLMQRAGARLRRSR